MGPIFRVVTIYDPPTFGILETRVGKLDVYSETLESSLIDEIAMNPVNGRIATTGTDTVPIRSVSVSADGKLIATGSEDYTVRVWDCATRKEILTARNHREMVLETAFSPDGSCLASASSDKTFRIWNASRPMPASES